jgi:anti-sigma factor (TIGR02949 family)
MDDDCRQVLRELQTFLDGEDPTELHRAIEHHLDDCPPCMDRAAFHTDLKVFIASKCTDTAPPGLIDRVRQHLWPTV